ncbi:MAG: UDP-N-acetylmuramoyl-tripeptide--D-alanyl-D-alanine ligase [Bacteroidales bacterium]|nr:UDP-N-acetylmuramoyl-tripeptide--D-alanyl-D-alanine ligase [Bacteroidales bacterium]
MLNTIFILLAAICLINLLVELRRDLMMLQQNSYRPERYMRWLRTSADTTSFPRLVGMAVLLVSLVTFTDTWWAMGMMAVFAGGCTIALLRQRYKKPLVWTSRAKRIYATMLLLSAIIVAALDIISYHIPYEANSDSRVAYLSFISAVTLTGLYCASHMIALVAVWLLQPLESKINQGYYDDAERILRSMPRLRVIGITGSYGKTSTKHYLYRILSEQMEVLMTPGSYNTTMGVIRTVREMLRPYHEVFICEMGAKQPGDIKEICDLVHPEIGILTAVGPQHLESFKTIENVQRTKFELIDALPKGGLAVVNNDFEYIANREVTNVSCLRYGIKNTKEVDYTASDIIYTSMGTDFTITANGQRLTLHTRLVGECNISNLMAAVAVALYLGVDREKIRYAVAKIEQVEHRLSLKRTPAGVTIIDDAFNSNPTGSAMALDVLAGMRSGKRIVITPGMIELGDRQHELNAELGRRIARSADIAIVVGNYNREAITEGLHGAGMEEDRIHEVKTFAEAQRVLAAVVRRGDTVLYENDLPDTFK